MISFTDIVVVLGMIFVRIGIPALVIVAFAYGLKRLDRRWEVEARQNRAKTTAEQPAVPAPQPGSRPGAPARRPAEQPAPLPIPFIPPPLPNKEQRPGLYVQTGVAPSKAQRPGMAAQPGIQAASAPCWDVKGCSDAKKVNCAAPSHPDQLCWQARFNAEGHIPEECVGCDIFQRHPPM